MKNVFIINSSVTLHACKAVIRHLDIELKSVHIIAGRGFAKRLNKEFIHVWDIDILGPPSVPTTARFWERYKAMSRFDEFINRQIQFSQFNLFLPHTITPFYQLLAGHSKCVEFNYFEEGLVAFRHPEEIKESMEPMIPQLSGLHRWAMKGRWSFDWPFDRRAGCAFGLLPGSFVNYNLEVVSLRPDWNESPELRRVYDNAILCVLPPARPTGHSPWTIEAYYKAILELKRSLKKCDRPIKVRFHPEQGRGERELVHSLLDDGGFELAIVDDEESIESICASAEVKVVHAGSSVALYASHMGRPTYNFLCLFGREQQGVVNWDRIKRHLSLSLNENQIFDLS